MGERSLPEVRLGRWAYDPEDLLASGPTAATYGGTDLENEEEVVVKVFDHVTGQRAKERFQREARLHDALEHEAILQLLGYGTEREVDYIVTPRLRPGSLWNALEEEGPLPLATVRSIGLRIAAALAYMHGRGEVHGDISPGNILLDEGRSAYLADFGFSKRVEPVPVATSGDAYGTAGFRAPREIGTARTYEDDVYGLAAVLWFCLTAQAPAQWDKARRRELPSRKLRTPLDSALRWGEVRIPSAEEFGKSLEKAWPKTAKDWRARTSRRHRSPVPALLAAGLVGLLLAFAGGQLLAPKPDALPLTSVDGEGVALKLKGDWHQRPPPDIPAFEFRARVAAARGRTTVIAGRAPSPGPALLSARARKTLPVRARKEHAVLVGEREALSYGPASRFGGAIEVLAMPLERSVLLVRCGGPAATLKLICSQAAAEVTVRGESVQALAPDPKQAQLIRRLVGHFRKRRSQVRADLAAASNHADGSEAGGRLASLNRNLATGLSSLSPNAQDFAVLSAVVASAQGAAGAYERLADAKTTSAWVSARDEVLARDSALTVAIGHLRSVPVYPVESLTGVR